MWSQYLVCEGAAGSRFLEGFQTFTTHWHWTLHDAKAFHVFHLTKTQPSLVLLLFSHCDTTNRWEHMYAFRQNLDVAQCHFINCGRVGVFFYSNTDELQASNVRLRPHHFADCFEVKCANHFGMIPFFLLFSCLVCMFCNSKCLLPEGAKLSVSLNFQRIVMW